MKKLIISTALILSAGLASAAEPCRPAPEMDAMLRSDFGQVPAATAMTDAGSLMLIYADPESRKFTITITKPGQDSCIGLEGKAYTVVPSPDGGGNDD